MRILKGKTVRPRRVILYGPHGIGKSTWASKAPSPLALSCEDGLDDVGMDRTPLLASLGHVHDAMSYLLTQDHEYRTVVIDTVDWLERLIWEHTCQAGSKASIEDFGYGKGYVFALQHWEFLVKGLNHLRNDKGMAVILLAHARVVKVEPPDAPSYHRYEPDLHRTVCPMLQEWADEVLFATKRVDVIQEDEGFNRERGRAIGDGERIVWTTERPTHVAKRRIAMPDTIPLEFGAYAKFVRANAASDIQGIVTDGSSKPKKEETTDG